MKYKFLILLTLFFGINSFAQNNKSDFYDSFVENENFNVQMKLSDNKHIIKYSRKIDSLNFHIEVNPSLKKIFDSVSHLNKNEKVFMRISRMENTLYQIDQMNFLNADGRNISLHKHSDQQFNIDLSDYKIKVIDCKNCKEEISFQIYESEIPKN
ncbi:hypothetical protein BC962_3278 [Gillisia mitskevichiae]|uniref:Intein n=1 Tax=Gillisia mitskevichiae TaxID=270921 RepID=A0A495P1G1_9FLAO|nr:hypothetical protein [Gillisia mitskevichiae]RKS42489.1 hypothetical protein BC962_3278 [Gillisia mitskevichiae]